MPTRRRLATVTSTIGRVAGFVRYSNPLCQNALVDPTELEALICRLSSEVSTSDLEAFFVAHGLGAAFRGPTKGWGRKKRVTEALVEAERVGCLTEIVSAAAERFGMETPSVSPESGFIRIRLQDDWWFDPTHQLGPPGGFGAVFGGQSTAGQQVAVKQLHEHRLSEAQRELEIAELLVGGSHERIVPVYDAGFDEDSRRHYIVMARADESLEDDLDRVGPLDEAEGVSVLASITTGLLEVSQLVHRDLKPGNVLRFDGRWCLADFGIAKLIEESTSLHTLRGFLSAPYAAPEQWEGDRPTHATDVYALGCIAHRLLTGSPPFRGPNRDDFKRQHLGEDPPSLEHVASPRLRALISAMLRKRSVARPSLERVATVLETLSPSLDTGEGSSALAQVAAHIAESQLSAESTAESAQRRLEQRTRDALLGLEILNGNLGRLAELVENETVGAATVRFIPSGLEVDLGRGQLRVATPHHLVDAGAFDPCDWDVVVGAHIAVTQDGVQSYPGRGASLWYGIIRGAEQLRWWEVPYMVSPMSRRERPDQPFSIMDLQEAAEAASGIMGLYQLAGTPTPIDDEDFGAFSRRWLDFLAEAARGGLRHPRRLPES